MVTRNGLRTASLFAAMLVGSCATPPDHPALFEDGAANHAISVEPTYRSLKLAYAGTLSPEDTAKLADFVGDYMQRGNGAISISAPPGPDSAKTITALGEELAGMGVSRSRILVGVGDQADSDGRVEIGYVTYLAHTDACGDWSVNAGDTSDNTPMPNYGCAVQHNVAAMVADPRDLSEARGLGPADATRRMVVLNKYEQAQPTAATKTKEQSGTVSDVGNQQQ